MSLKLSRRELNASDDMYYDVFTGRERFRVMVMLKVPNLLITPETFVYILKCFCVKFLNSLFITISVTLLWLWSGLCGPFTALERSSQRPNGLPGSQVSKIFHYFL